MKTPTTEYANRAMAELYELKFVISHLASDIRSDERDLVEKNRRWRGTTPVTNEPFNGAAFTIFGAVLICQAVDIYNWYCRETFKLALSSSPQLVIDVLRTKASKISKSAIAAEKKGKDAAQQIIEQFLDDRATGEWHIREAVHRHLDVLQNPEIELLCTCRNVLVHQRGHDDYGKIADRLQKLGKSRALIGAPMYPPGHMPIALGPDNRLLVDPKTGDWATELIQQQIFMMDQNFAHVYKLPRKVYERRSIGRSYLCERK